MTSATTADPGKVVQAGGTLTFVYNQEPANFDPASNNNSPTFDGLPGFALYDMLIYTDPVNGGVVPQTAQSLTSSDGLVWTLKLRQNIKFTDGTPYDAAAVKYNIQRLQNPASQAVYATQANSVQSMEVIDAVTLRLTLKAKNATFPGVLALIPFVASPTALQTQGTSYGSQPVGAGPFMLKSWTHGGDMVFVRNPNYWNSPRPYIDQLVLRAIADETQRINSFASGEANMVYVSSPQNADNMMKRNLGTSYPMILNGGTNIYFDTTKLPFSDVRARQAIAQAIDFSDYSKVVDSGIIEPIDSVFRHDSPFYDPTILQPAYNPTKAQQLFDQFAADHGPLEFTISVATSPSYQLSAQYIQGALSKYKNVKMNLHTQAATALLASCSSRADAACMLGNIFDDPEPTWTTQYTCSASPSRTGWCNSKFDADVADNQATLDPNKRISDIKDAQRLFYADMPALSVERRYSWTFSAPNIQDFQYVNTGMIMPDRLWIKSH